MVASFSRKVVAKREKMFDSPNNVLPVILVWDIISRAIYSGRPFLTEKCLFCTFSGSR